MQQAASYCKLRVQHYLQQQVASYSKHCLHSKLHLQMVAWIIATACIAFTASGLRNKHPHTASTASPIPSCAASSLMEVSGVPQ